MDGRSALDLEPKMPASNSSPPASLLCEFQQVSPLPHSSRPVWLLVCKPSPPFTG